MDETDTTKRNERFFDMALIGKMLQSYKSDHIHSHIQTSLNHDFGVVYPINWISGAFNLKKS
jgi:hypothetical protein